MGFVRGFGLVSRRERHDADLFFADLIGRPATRPRLGYPRLREDESSFEQTAPADLGEATVGGVRLAITVPATGDERRPDLETGLRWALGSGRSFAIRGSLYAPGEVRLSAWTPSAGATPLPSTLPPVIDCQARAADLCALVLATGGNVAVYFPALRGGAAGITEAQRRRWVVVPKLRDLYALPAAMQTAHRRRTIGALARVTGLGFSRAQLDALSTPALQLLLAQNGAAAFPVTRVNRGSPPADRGGVVNGVTLPVPVLPIVEPDCYLPVISEAEGKLESINAWDAQAGISLGPIQFNVTVPANDSVQPVFRFLWRLMIDDRTLFEQAFGGLGWRLRFDPGGPTPSAADAFVLTINTGTPAEATLRSLPGDMVRNYRFFQTGVPDQAGFAPAFRRDLAGRFRDAVVWPHMQQVILDVSSVWLAPGLAQIRAAGIPALDRQNPDRDTFVLTAVLLSAFVRFSGCLQPLLRALRQWNTVAEKLAHVGDAVATLTDPCPSLSERLRSQAATARAVHAGLESIGRQRAGGGRAEAVGGTFAEDQAAAEVPRAVAPHILDFRATTIMAGDPLAFRTSLADKAAEMVRKMEDLGIRDEPRGRRDAYIDAVAWNESDEMRRGLRTCPKVGGQCVLSSCGLVVRSLWRLLGARDVFTDAAGGPIRLLDPPYRPGTVMTALRRYAELSGALEAVRTRADLDRANPQPGDAIFINAGNSQHVFTVVERDGDRFVSVDGGQSGNGDGGCCAIQRRERTLNRGAVSFAGDARPITGVVKLSRLRLTAPLIDLERRTPAGGPR